MIEVHGIDAARAAVTFRLSETRVTEYVAVVGDFNDWDPDATMMAPAGTDLEVTVELTIGRQYRFRYLVDGHRWENDWEADDYQPNSYGGDDSVVDLRRDGPRSAALTPDQPVSAPVPTDR